MGDLIHFHDFKHPLHVGDSLTSLQAQTPQLQLYVCSWMFAPLCPIDFSAQNELVTNLSPRADSSSHAPHSQFLALPYNLHT